MQENMENVTLTKLTPNLLILNSSPHLILTQMHYKTSDLSFRMPTALKQHSLTKHRMKDQRHHKFNTPSQFARM